MPRAEEFDAFYARTRTRLLHQTYALTGDLGAAAAATRDAFAHAWQSWHRLRGRDVEGWVAEEARRLATFRHYAHLRRRLDETGADTALVAGLQELPAQARRLVLLQTLGDRGLADAARELTMDEAAARETTDAALRKLAPGRSLAELGERVESLRAVSDRVALPRAVAIRRQGWRRRRLTTLAAVAASAAVVAGAGVVVALPGASDQEVATQDRRQLGEPTPQPRPPPPGASKQQLLYPGELTTLQPAAAWQIRRKADATRWPCHDTRGADPRARDAYQQTYRADTAARQRLLQTVEVSRGDAAAKRAYESTVGWWAQCQAPRTQLLAAHRIPRRGGAIEILTLRRWTEPARTLTVAVSRTGVVTTALVHEVARPEGPPPAAVSSAMSDALNLLCSTSDGPCGVEAGPRPVALPPTGEGPGFLGAIDLPPVGNLTTSWVGTDPSSAATNPAATLCDESDFTSSRFVRARSRTFVIPESDLPQRFGLSETLGTVRGEGLAQRFVAQVVSDVQSCEDRELSVSVEAGEQVAQGRVRGQAWLLSVEVSDGAAVTYRLGVVRVGVSVAQLSFSGTEVADVGADAFAGLVLRAGERLTELEDSAGPGAAPGRGRASLTQR